jgi:hypothetical protein
MTQVMFHTRKGVNNMNRYKQFEEKCKVCPWNTMCSVELTQVLGCMSDNEKENDKCQPIK